MTSIYECLECGDSVDEDQGEGDGQYCDECLTAAEEDDDAARSMSDELRSHVR